MAVAKKPRRHHHLSRESIARAALDIVDSEGADALTIRRVAGSLGVSVMSLYTYVADKDSIVRDIVALLLAEAEINEDAGVDWEDAVIAGARSLRAMALRHPRAFPFVALADYGEQPLAAYGRRVDQALLRQGVPPDLLPILASMLDAFSTGFLMLETKALTRPVEEPGNPFGDELHTPAPLYTLTHSDEAYEQGVRLIIAGLKASYGSAGATPSPAQES